MSKKYISADQLLRDAVELGMQVARSGFRPDLIVGVWRGGAPVAVAVHEVLAFAGLGCDHIAVRTASYTGIGTRSRVTVDGLDYLARHVERTAALLIVDDVHDTGLSIAQLLDDLRALYESSSPDIRVAVPYYKPLNNQTGRVPDYYLHKVNEWLVFPHELLGLADTEILAGKPGLQDLPAKLLQLRSQLQTKTPAE
jgi:hypothetical protein